MTKPVEHTPIQAHMPETYRTIEKMGLAAKLAHLEAFGFTVIEPEHVAEPQFFRRLRDRILAIAEARSGVKPDLETGATHADREGPTGQHLFYLLFDDPIFEQALMNPVVLAFMTYLLGPDCLLSSASSIIKGPGKVPLMLHSDSANIPTPLPHQMMVANATYLLTDYTKENGALFFVPCSHRLAREPNMAERANEELRYTIEAPAGSLVIWGGTMWHGAHARTAPGLRINLILYFCRMFMRTQELYHGNVPAEVLARNNERFARLMGEHVWYGWKSEGPNAVKQRAASWLDYGRS
ncbi:MAG: phytanoyl-CoA dioxygenase family protein [Alphaproteobacteria bacterium]|nr:phytanoyl-CoA dioxygenase family protein [Alphaproteobacteria bacterium]